MRARHGCDPAAVAVTSRWRMNIGREERRRRRREVVQGDRSENPEQGTDPGARGGGWRPARRASSSSRSCSSGATAATSTSCCSRPAASSWSATRCSSAGQPIGTVDDISLTADAQADVTISVDEPLHDGTTGDRSARPRSRGSPTATSRSRPGPNSEPEIPDGATIPPTKTTSPVDIDQLFDTFNAKTRRACQTFIQGQATVYTEQRQGRQPRLQVPRARAAVDLPPARRADPRPADVLRVPRLRLARARARSPSAATTSPR